MTLPARSRTAALLGVCSLLLAAPSLAEEAHDHERGDHEEHGDHDERGHEDEAVRLAPEVLTEFGVEIATAGPGVIVRHVSLPAEVRPNQDGLAHLAPRFPGVATEVRRTVGDTVKAGETLAIVEASQSLSRYPIKTLIDGVVIERHVTRGEPVSQERGPLFTVADLATVWIDASVYQRHLRDLAVGQHVCVSAGHGLAEAEGTLSYIAPVVDERTRTAIARVVLENPDGLWRPGMFVTADVEVEREEVAVAVPHSALARVEGHATVFVQGPEGLEPRAVEIGGQGEDAVEIVSGLAAGERYAVRGSFTLQSELAREELSGGHSH